VLLPPSEMLLIEAPDGLFHISLYLGETLEGAPFPMNFRFLVAIGFGTNVHSSLYFWKSSRS
jgi:hypothetical protein